MTIRRIESSGCVIYMTEAEYQLKKIGWQAYCEQFQPKPPKQRARFLKAMGFDRATISHCLQVSKTTVTRWLAESAQSRQKRREYNRRYKARLAAEQAAQRKARWATPSELAERLGVTAETVRNWIRTGKLEAVNMAKPGAKRPTYRIRCLES